MQLVKISGRLRVSCNSHTPEYTNKHNDHDDSNQPGMGEFESGIFS